MPKYQVDLENDSKFVNLCQDFVNEFSDVIPANIEVNIKKDFLNWKNQEFKKIDVYRDNAIEKVKIANQVDLNEIEIHYPSIFYEANRINRLLNF